MPIRSDDMNFYYNWTVPNIEWAELDADAVLKHLQAARTAYDAAVLRGSWRDEELTSLLFDDLGSELRAPLREIKEELDRREAALEREHERRETAAVRR